MQQMFLDVTCTPPLASFVGLLSLNSKTIGQQQHIFSRVAGNTNQNEHIVGCNVRKVTTSWIQITSIQKKLNTSRRMSDTGCQREDEENINSIDGTLKKMDKKWQRVYGNVYIKLNLSFA